MQQWSCRMKYSSIWSPGKANHDWDQPQDWKINGRFCIILLYVDNISTAMSKDTLLFNMDTIAHNRRQCYSFTMMLLALEFQDPIVLSSGFDHKVMSICWNTTFFDVVNLMIGMHMTRGIKKHLISLGKMTQNIDLLFSLPSCACTSQKLEQNQHEVMSLTTMFIYKL